MIARGHKHILRPATLRTRPDGATVVHSTCIGANGPTQCKLEEERVFKNENPVSLRYRYGGIWFTALELLRLLPICEGIAECPECHGEKTLVPCERCAGAGVVDGDGLITMPDLRVNPVSATDSADE